MSWRRMTQPKLIDRDDIVILKRVNFSVLDEDFDGKIHFFHLLSKIFIEMEILQNHILVM